LSNFEFIKPEDLYQTYSDAKTFMIPLHEPFDEFERIARNKPHPGIAKNLPKVTDGTLAALIQEQPKRIIQQIPTGKVKSDSEWLDIMAGWVLEHEILPNANQVAALIQKAWALTSKTLTYGSQPAFVQFVNRGEYFGTDFTLPYIKDVFLEPGKLSDRDSNVIFLRSWWTKNQVESVIAKEKMLAKSAKKRGEDYETGWDIAKLEQLKGMSGQKDENSMTPNERNKQLNAGFIEIVHCFQRGIGNTFYSFSPLLGDKDNIIRTRKNKDPRGVIPIHFMYANVDLSNPLGRGSVELSGGMQNLLDSQVQSFQYMQALLMNPPIEKRGNFSKSTIKYAPAEIWDMGTDPNASVTPVKLTTEAVTSFPNNYGLIKSQILNLNSGGTDNAISASVGDPQSSKTPQGVDAQQARLGVSDNYMRKQFEDCFQEIMETAINLYFAERNGTQLITLDDETAEKLRKIAPESVNEKNEVQIDFDSETEKLQFEVDASTSSLKDDASERDRLVELLDLSGKYPQLAQLMGEAGTKELINRIIVKSGVEDPEKIMPSGEGEVDPQTGQPIQEQPQGPDPQMIQQMVVETVQQAMQEKDANDPKNNPTIQLMDALKIKFVDLPEDSQHQVLEQVGLTSQEPTTTAQELAIKATDAGVRVGQMNYQANQADMQNEQSMQTQQQEQDTQAQDQALIQGLTQRGYTPEQAQQAVDYMKQGVPSDQIIKALNTQEATV